MMNNPYLVSHFPRQPNVMIIVTDSEGQLINLYNKVTTMDLMVVRGVTILEIREYASSEATDPTAATTLVNPRRWLLMAKPDPEKVAAL